MDIDPNKAVDFLLANAPKYAKARAERIYIEQYRKSLKAILFTESNSKTVADREAEAYSHPKYLDLLHGLQAAVEAEEQVLASSLVQRASIRRAIFRKCRRSAGVPARGYGR